MVQTILFGLTTGAILYFASVGFSLTFGTLRIVNFAHTLSFALGAYIVMSAVTHWGLGFGYGIVMALLLTIPLAYIIERFIIRRLYGESLDYAFISTYAVAFIGIDLIKGIWGVRAHPLSDPFGITVRIWDMNFPLYRLCIVIAAVLLFLAIQYILKRSIAGKVVVAALEDTDHVRTLGIKVNKFFSLLFVVGSILAALGSALCALTAIYPYMGTHYILLCFAVVIVGGMNNLKGTFYSAFGLGLVMALSARFYPQAGEVMIFVVMAIVLLLRPIDA